MDWFSINPNLARYLAGVTAWSDLGQAISPRLTSLIFRSVQIEDVDQIIEMHERSSERTIYSRYHSPRLPTRQEIAQICQLNGENGRAVVAAVVGQKPEIVGLAYYIALDGETAEPALMVEDRFQRQGVGKQLFCQLAALASAHGICFFEAHVLPTNKPMIHLLHKIGQVLQNKLVYSAREIRIQLTAVPAFELIEGPKESVVEEIFCLTA